MQSLYKYPSRHSKIAYPYLLDIQRDFLSELVTMACQTT